MREILFRAKRIDTGDWVEGSYHHQTDYYGDPCDKHYIIDGTETDMEGYGGHYEIDPETLCQCTGKPDEDGKKIFEGDIVGFIDLYSTESGYSESGCLGEVVWSEKECKGGGAKMILTFVLGLIAGVAAGVAVMALMEMAGRNEVE